VLLVSLPSGRCTLSLFNNVPTDEDFHRLKKLFSSAEDPDCSRELFDEVFSGIPISLLDLDCNKAVLAISIDSESDEEFLLLPIYEGSEQCEGNVEMVVKFDS
jgi:hypothetical protein